MSRSNEKHKSSLALGGSPILWLALLLLLILFMSFGLLVTTVVSCVNSPEHNIISLNIHPDELDENLWYRVIYRRVKGNAGSVVLDDVGQWEINTEVEIFRDSYLSENGGVKARSEDGTAIVAPGTSGVYDFSLKNVGNLVLNYTLSLSGDFETGGRTVPLYLRLLKNGVPAESSYGSWTYGPELENLQEQGTLTVGQSADYTLEWLWPFEGSEEFPSHGDAYDTWLGDEPLVQTDPVIVTLLTLAEEVPGAVAVDENGVPIYEELFDERQRALLLALAGVSLAALGGIIFLLARRRLFVTGYVHTTAPALGWRRQEATVYDTGRFFFKAVPAGKHRFTLKAADGSTLATWEWRLVRRSESEPALRAEEKDGRTVITVDRSIRALELTLNVSGDRVTLAPSPWYLIDKENTVLTDAGMRIERLDDDTNRTPLGLTADRRHRFTVPEEQGDEA